MTTDAMGKAHTTARLPARPTEVIERDRPIHFTFAGKPFVGYAGDVISSALWAHGQRAIGRSFKYHRPRGDLAFDGTGPNALVQLGEEPNVRAGRRPIADGMGVEPQNVRPSLHFDVMAINTLLHRFLPVGFYYKAFHSKRLWPFYERMFRHAAGLGKVYRQTSSSPYDKQYRHADVVVIGGGPAGLSAAIAGAEAGAQVLVIEQERFLGGGLCYRPGAHHERRVDLVRTLTEQVDSLDNVDVLTNAVAMGYYDEHWIAAFTDERLYKVRGGAMVTATGSTNRVPVFSNNDLPGIMTADGAARLLNLYAVRPGRKVLIASANDEGLQLALDLRDAGVDVEVAEERDEDTAGWTSELSQAGIPVHWRTAISEARGRHQVEGVRLLQLRENGELPSSPRPARTIECDALVLALGFTPNANLMAQSHGRVEWDDASQEMRPVELPTGVHAAGRLTGIYDLAGVQLEGQIAGRNAAADAGIGSGADANDLHDLDERRNRERTQRRTTRHYAVPGPGEFRFVDFSEDVTEQDVYDAIAEGYDSVELLKRYTTISMGPDQGRYGSLNSVLMTAEATECSVQATGRTTSRPPTLPIKMGTLAGRNLEPLRRTPLHHWHERYGCHWLNVGQWKRAESYHRHTPSEEVRNVRSNVGLIDVSTLGKIRLSGPDVPELLSRLYTNKWRKLPIGNVRYGLMCNEEGVISDDGVTARLDEDEYYMTVTTGGADAIPDGIRWWLQSGWDLDVHVVNRTTDYAAINVAGPNARRLLERVAEDVDLSNEAFPFMGVRQGQVAGVEALLLRIGFTGELGYEIHVPAGYAQPLWTRLLEVGEDLDAMPFGLEAQRILRLEKGHLIVGQDTDSLSSPLDAGQEWVVKTDKDDFIGKSALLRQRERGVEHRLVGFQMADASVVPPEGVLVVEQAADNRLQMSGYVTSARFSPTLERSIGLAWVTCERAEPGSTIAIRIDGALHGAQVVGMPFYDPQGEALRS